MEPDQGHSPKTSRQNSSNSEGNAKNNERTDRSESVAEATDKLTDLASSSGNQPYCESENVADSTEATDDFLNKMTSVLYEVIQNLLTDVLSVLDKVSAAFIWLS